jgi:hypothetical protein
MKNIVIEILNEVFVDWKFYDKKNTWLIENDFTVVLCQYQKSRHSNAFYLNLGIIIKPMIASKIRSYKYEHSHLINRYSRLYDDHSIYDIEDKEFLEYNRLKKELTPMINMIKLSLLPYLESIIKFNNIFRYT